MKKYLTKQILLTILSVIGVFALFAFLFGQYVLIEDDFFLDGEVTFVTRSWDGNRRVYATAEQTELVKEWLTTLEKTSEEYEDGFVMLNSALIRIKTDNSTVFFELWGDEIVVTIDTGFFSDEMGNFDKWVRARSSDIELTGRVFDMCCKAVDEAESTLDPVWLE